MAEPASRGRFLWYDTMTTDVQGAIAFYTKVTGWGTQTWNGTGEPYHMWANGDRPIGGLMKMPPDVPAPPHWLGYIGTPDVDATAARAKQLGATIMVPPTEIPTVGKFAVLSDPQGVVFAAFTPASAAMPLQAPGVGDISWHELATTDLDAAFGFYSDLFGWVKKNAMDMGPMGIYQEYGTADQVLGGMYVKPKDMPAPPHFMFYIRVPDLDVAYARVKELGGQVLQEPTEVPGGDRITVGVDPQGAAFALHWKHA